MTKYQNGVMWLGIALVFVRFLTSGQGLLFHNLLGQNTMQPVPAQSPQNAQQNPGLQPNPQPGPSPKPPHKGPPQTSPGGRMQPAPSPFSGG